MSCAQISGIRPRTRQTGKSSRCNYAEPVRRKLAEKQRREIAESVVSGRKSGAEMARLYGVSEPTVSRIVAAHRQSMEVNSA
jgi:transposase-like protein